MNDQTIRTHFHNKKLKAHHSNSDTLVLDELGILHGNCRADIAVINGYLCAYEIKSDEDNLKRLKKQIESYNSVFDRVSIIVGEKYFSKVLTEVPEWWGVICCKKGVKGGISFTTVRSAQKNPNQNMFSVAQLLWKDEAAEIAKQLGADNKLMRKPRNTIYKYLVDNMSSVKLRKTVRTILKNRTNWRCHQQLL